MSQKENTENARSVAHVTSTDANSNNPGRNHTTKKHHTKQPMRSIEQYKEMIREDHARAALVPVDIKIYQKTSSEKSHLKMLTKAHKKSILIAGKNPKKDMNP